MKKTYLITGIESELLKEFKSACAHYEISMRENLIIHMKDIANGFTVWKSVKEKTKPNPKKGGRKG